MNIEKSSSREEKIKNVLSFFGVSIKDKVEVLFKKAGADKYNWEEGEVFGADFDKEELIIKLLSGEIIRLNKSQINDLEKSDAEDEDDEEEEELEEKKFKLGQSVNYLASPSGNEEWTIHVFDEKQKIAILRQRSLKAPRGFYERKVTLKALETFQAKEYTEPELEEEEKESIEEIKKGMDKSKIEILEKSKKISEFLDEIERDFILFDRNFSLIQNDIEYWSKFTEDRREDIKNEAEKRIKNYEELLSNLEKIKNIIFASREKILDAKKGKLKISLSDIQEIYKSIKEIFEVAARPEGGEDYANKQLRINEILSKELEKIISPEYAERIKKMEEIAEMLQKEYNEKIKDSEFITGKEKSDFLAAIQEDKKLLEELKAEAGK